MDNLKIKEKKTKQSILTDLFFFFISPTLSAILLASCFNPKIPSSFCWISLIPLIASGDFYKQSPVKRFGCGFFFGIIFFALSFWWIGLVTVIGTVALIAYLALYPAIWLLAISPPFVNYQSTSAKDNLINALVIANLWIISEWFRSWLFSGFPWNELGSSAYKNILLIQLCSLGGVFLLSWFIAFINALLYFMVRSVFSHFTTKLLYLPKIEALTAILLFGLGFFYGEQRLIKDSAEDKALKIRFAAIQPNIPQEIGRAHV